jgi:hypothetical protein
MATTSKEGSRRENYPISIKEAVTRNNSSAPFGEEVLFIVWNDFRLKFY